ncbi:MAG TPA: outer membrane beta-barrel protein [Puia sp.]|nr:outer membrane beta-barrel protein [Puia sp.]
MHYIKPGILCVFLCLFSSFVHGQSKPVPKNAADTTPIKVDSLRAAIVTATLRPYMKGDTLEYNTDHLLLQRNAVVEDLLKRLPGLQIDPDGTITYNGEKIQHLLVDGEDIFGDDPTMVTRNFNASKIARVQVLDRKSDQAIFTGIDDGQRTKTLNLVMKDDARNGYFGKVEGGGSTDGYYNANAALAAFRDKEQFTALGIAANTGVTGFSNAGSGAAVNFMNGNADALDASAGIGIPQFEAAALHYANTWPGRGNHLTANYQFSHYYTQPQTFSQTLQTEPGSEYRQKQSTRSTNRQDQHWLYSIYDWAPSDRSAFKVTFHFSNSAGDNQYGATGSSSFNDTLVNSSLRTINDKVTRMNIGGVLSWRLQIGKLADRVFSVNAGATKVDIATKGYLYSLNQFYDANGLVQSMDTVDQRKQIASHNINIIGSINYTEPLWNGAILGASYGMSHTSDDPLQTTFDQGDGKYTEVVDSLSSHFETQNVSQRATLNLQGKGRRVNYTIGGDWIGYSYSQRDVIGDFMMHLHYSNWAPRAMLNYTLNKTTYLSFDYMASTQQPSISQLTPVTNNNDPLHINLGNHNLKPGFNQNFRLDFRHFRTWLVNVSLNLGLISNSIGMKTITDSLGRQISQPVNVDGAKSAGANLSLARRILGFDAGFHASATYARSVSYINADLSRNDAYTGGGGFSVNRYVQDKYSLQLNTNFVYFDQISSINAAAPVRYWTQTHAGAVTLYLIRDLEINTNAVYTWQQKTSAFSANTSVVLWNAYVSRNFLHGKLVGRFQLNNILDANAGINRSNTGNINTQSFTNILGRYWMLSAIYHFDKKFKKK